MDNNLSQQQPTTPPHKKLWRSRKDRKIAGICGGMATYFNVDSIWIRLIFVLFFLAGGSGFLLYLILWLLIPIEPI